MNRTEEYRKLSKKLNIANSKANKRLRRLKAKGLKTPAHDYAMKTGGKFKNSKNMTYQEMQKEYHRVNNFLNSKTSTYRGTTKVINDTLKATGLPKEYTKGSIFKKQKTMDKFFHVYGKLKELDRLQGRYRSYESAFNSISNYVEKNGFDGSIDSMLEGLTRDDKI